MTQEPREGVFTLLVGLEWIFFTLWLVLIFLFDLGPTITVLPAVLVGLIYFGRRILFPKHRALREFYRIARAMRRGARGL